MFIRANTDNPLGQRPFQHMARQQGMGWLGDGALVPTGATLTYTATWSPIHGAASDVAAALTAQLPAGGMQLLSYNATGTSLLGIGSAGIVATVMVTGPGFAQIADAQSILQTIAQSVLGVGNLTTSTLVISATPGSAAIVAATPQPQADFTTWVENNAVYIGAGLLALVLLPALVRKL